MPLIIECGVGYKVVSQKVCLILRRSENFGSMKERRNGGLVVVKSLEPSRCVEMEPLTEFAYCCLASSKTLLHRFRASWKRRLLSKVPERLYFLKNGYDGQLL